MSQPHDFSESVRNQVETIARDGVRATSGLYDLTSVRLVRFATTITRNQHDAEDAVAATLLKVVGDIEVLSRAQNPWAFLLQMVRNEALLILRRKSRWTCAVQRIAECLSDLVQAPSSVDALESQESMQSIWNALRQLPTQQAEVVVLKIWEDFTFHQIGQMLGIPPATAASRYRYGLEKLSELLAKDPLPQISQRANHGC